MKRVPVGIALVIIILFLVFIFAPSADASVAKRFRKETIQLINTYRVNHHLTKVKYSYTLNQLAKRKARQMARNYTVSHSGYRNRAAYYFRHGGQLYGEVIASGYGLTGFPKYIVYKWRHSKQHLAILKNRRMTEYGAWVVKRWTPYGPAYYYCVILGTRLSN